MVDGGNMFLCITSFSPSLSESHIQKKLVAMAMSGMEFFFDEHGTGYAPRDDAGAILQADAFAARIETLVTDMRIPKNFQDECETPAFDSINDPVAPGSECVADSDGFCSGDVNCSNPVDDVVEGVLTGSCWTRRVRLNDASEERRGKPNKIHALEASVEHVLLYWMFLFSCSTFLLKMQITIEHNGILQWNM